MARGLPFVVALSLAMATAGRASAAGDADVTLAREKVKEGVGAANAGKWDDARSAFAEAYRLYPRPSVLFNLAGAEIQTGHVLAGIDAYKKVLADPDGLTKAQVTLAESSLKAAQARVATITLHVAKRDCKAALDDVAIGIDEPRAVDPGAHHATLVCSSAQYADRREITVEAGQSRTVELHAPAPPPAITVAPVVEPPPSSTARTIGIVLAGAAVLTLGTSAVTGAVGMSQHGDLTDGCGATKTCDPDDVDRARTFVTISDATLVGGAVLAAGAIYALFVHPRVAGGSRTAAAPFVVRF